MGYLAFSFLFADEDGGEQEEEETDNDLRKGANELKKQLEETTDPVLRRKLKRMIKNRESAARSRARKQAYTAGLEEEVCFVMCNIWSKF